MLSGIFVSFFWHFVDIGMIRQGFFFNLWQPNHNFEMTLTIRISSRDSTYRRLLSQLSKKWTCFTSATTLTSEKLISTIGVFSDIRAVKMTVCWHYLLFQFSNFEFPNLTIYLRAANSHKSKEICCLIRIPRMTWFNHVLYHVEDWVLLFVAAVLQNINFLITITSMLCLTLF
jgi:hypothetical protein